MIIMIVENAVKRTVVIDRVHESIVQSLKMQHRAGKVHVTVLGGPEIIQHTHFKSQKTTRK